MECVDEEVYQVRACMICYIKKAMKGAIVLTESDKRSLSDAILYLDRHSGMNEVPDTAQVGDAYWPAYCHR